MGIRWLGGRISPHTSRSIALIFVGVIVFNVSSHLYDFVMVLIACRLNFFISAAACRSVTPGLWSGVLREHEATY